MSAFLKRTWVKVLLTIACSLLLGSGIFFGLLTGIIAIYGGFAEKQTLANNIQLSQIETDINEIMYGYFDADDPANPWGSYYSGSIFTGNHSNLVWEISDDDTGKVVLSTYDGTAETSFSTATTCSYDLYSEIDTETYTVSESTFVCGDTLFAYIQSEDYFYAVDSAPEDLNTETLPKSALYSGIGFLGSHYEFAGDGFYPTGDASVSYEYTTKYYTITCYILAGLPYSDKYQELGVLIDTLYNNRYLFCAMCGGLLLAGLILLGFLCYGMGRVGDQKEVTIGPLHRIPGELTLLIFVPSLLLLDISCNIAPSAYTLWAGIFVIFSFLSGLALTYFVATAAVRIKSHTLIRNTLCWRLWQLIKQLLSKLFAGCKALLLHLPLMWKVLGVYLLLCMAEFLALVIFTNYGTEVLLLFWFVEKLILGAGVAYVCLCFLRLKAGAERIAQGDYSTPVSEEHLVLDFQTTAKTLNHIQDGISIAVESRMRSERLKTELITNVSHDLKTPLTSIVTYVDLLNMEPAGSPAAAEYLQVLKRQSARMKKLIEDLVDASKASTGNIAVHSVPLDFSMLLHQAMGEYSERLESAYLTPIASLPETPVMLCADGRLLWRVLDNLLGNAVKYAMPRTRLYVTLTSDDQAVATFRNISRDELNVTPEELMERFVRGDSSRHTEGSGLGLSIAKSLAEAMGGTLVLAVDGDLFKATLTFPLLSDSDLPDLIEQD